MVVPLLVCHCTDLTFSPLPLASAAFGLAVAFMVGDKSKDSSPKTSLTNGTFAMIGTLL